MPLSPQERIRLARQVEKAEYRNFQACLHNSWIEQAAAALEIELEEDMYKGAPRLGGWEAASSTGFPLTIVASVTHPKQQWALFLSHAYSSWVGLPWTFLMCLILSHMTAHGVSDQEQTQQDVLIMQPVLLLCP